MPVRIQRKRSRGWRMPPNTIYVGRPGKWGNPFDWSTHGKANAAQLFREHIGQPNSTLAFKPADIESLRGKNLSCWCALDEPCHADVLLEIANASAK